MWKKDRLLNIRGRPQCPVHLKLDKNHLHIKGSNQLSKTYDRGLMSRNYKEPREFSKIKKASNPIKNVK